MKALHWYEQPFFAALAAFFRALPLQPGKIRWFDHISINLFWLGLNIRNNAVNNILMPYMVALLAAPEIRNTALGFMRTAGLIIAMLVQPAMGILSDRSTSRFGRRRPYIFAGVIFDLVCLALIAASGTYWLLLVAILFFQFSSNVSHGPLQGLIPDLVPQEQRGVASGVKSIMELVPVILVALVVAKMVSDGNFYLAVFVTGTSLLVIMLLTMLLVKEKPLVQKPDVPLAPTMLRVLGILAGILAGAAVGLACGGVIGGAAALVAWPLAGQSTALAIAVGLGGIVAMLVAVVVGVWGGTYTTIGYVVDWSGSLWQRVLAFARGVRPFAGQYGSFTWWVVNRLLFFTAITSFQAFLPFFLMYAFNASAEAAAGMTGTLTAVVGVFTLGTALPSGWLSDHFGYRRILAISGILAGVGAFLLLSTIWSPNTYLFTIGPLAINLGPMHLSLIGAMDVTLKLAFLYLGGTIIGLASGLFVTTNWALGTRLAPPAEAGRFLGISNLAGAGAGIVGTGLGGPMADYLEKVRPGLGYFVLFAGFAIIFILSSVSLRGIKKQS